MDLSYISGAGSQQLSQLSKSYDPIKIPATTKVQALVGKRPVAHTGVNSSHCLPDFDYPEMDRPRVVESQFAFVARLSLQSLCCSH